MNENWEILYVPDWDKHFKKLDVSIQKIIFKKIQQLINNLPSRSLHTINFKIEEVGQYRIAFFEDVKNKTRKIYFVGNHKEYEKWYKGFK